MPAALVSEQEAAPNQPAAVLAFSPNLKPLMSGLSVGLLPYTVVAGLALTVRVAGLMDRLSPT